MSRAAGSTCCNDLGITLNSASIRTILSNNHDLEENLRHDSFASKEPKSPRIPNLHHQSPPKTLRFLIAPIPAISTHYKNLAGGLNLSQKYESNWIISPIFRVKNKQYLKPPQILSKKTPKIPSVFDVIFGVRMRQKRVFLIDTTHHRVLCVGRNPKVGNIHFCGARSKNCCFYLEIFQYLLTLRGK